jgi:hypothetical protein
MKKARLLGEAGLFHGYVTRNLPTRIVQRKIPATPIAYRQVAADVVVGRESNCVTGAWPKGMKRAENKPPEPSGFGWRKYQRKSATT